MHEAEETRLRWENFRAAQAQKQAEEKARLQAEATRRAEAEQEQQQRIGIIQALTGKVRIRWVAAV